MSDSESDIEDNVPLGQLGQNARHRKGFPDSDSDTDIDLQPDTDEAVVDLQPTADQDQKQQANLLHVGPTRLERRGAHRSRSRHTESRQIFKPRWDVSTSTRSQQRATNTI